MATKSHSRTTSPTKKRSNSKKTDRPKKSPARKWSGKVTATSNAMDLEKDIFKSTSAKKIASSVKKSAERSKRRKGSPLQSAMSMLNFYENRAGKNLSTSKKKTLDNAKDELRKLFGKKSAQGKESRRVKSK